MRSCSVSQRREHTAPIRRSQADEGIERRRLPYASADGFFGILPTTWSNAGCRSRYECHMPTYPHEWLARQIVDQAQDAIVFADRDGVIRLWNAGAEAMFGYSVDEAVGQTLDLIIPERLRARHWTGFNSTMATGVTRYARQVLAVPAIRKDGTSISVEFTVALLHEPSGALVGITAIIRDVTARWEEERELKKRLAALEAKSSTG
jgi:PAS domain S-box-containing protein